MLKFLKATLLNGTAIIGEFTSLGGSGQGYATQVFAGAKPFNAWKTVGTNHPVTGEAVRIRERVMFSGTQVLSIQQVKPKEGFADSHNYAPENFEAVSEIQHGEYGLYVAPSNDVPEGIQPGVGYPVHRDTELRRYVITRAANGDAAEQRVYLDVNPVTDAPSLAGGDGESRHIRSGPADADEDDGF